MADLVIKNDLSITETHRIHSMIGDKADRSALIIFKDKKFERVEFYPKCTPYTAEEWEFLGAISERVRTLMEYYKKQ